MRWTFGMALAALLGACATPPATGPLPQLEAWLAAGGAPPPPVEACPTVAAIDLRAIAAQQAAGAAPSAADRLDEVFGALEIPEGFRRPPSDALVVLTAVEPPGGLYSNTVWSVVWKEADGGWWFWRQNRTGEPPPPPPPPPGPGADAAERQAYETAVAAYPPPDHERWPPVFGPLAPARVAVLEQALSDPCRAWEPDIWPWDPPLRRRASQPGPPPPQDWTPIYVRIEEMGRPARVITAPNDRPSLARDIRSVAYYPL